MVNLVWGRHVIKKLEGQEVEEKFSGCMSSRLEKFGDLNKLEDGYYNFEGTDQYFYIKTVTVEQLNSTWREIIAPFKNCEIIENYSERIYEREEQEKLAVTLSEIRIFNDNLDTPLEFVDGAAVMKNYYHKTIEIKEIPDCPVLHELFIDGRCHGEVHYDEDKNKYGVHDGAEGYGWYDALKKAVKSYMDWNFKYPTDEEYDVPNCARCGDGGCFLCEPYRFL